jgi:hypothetical protein
VAETKATEELLGIWQARLDRGVARAERAIAEADFEGWVARGRRLRARLPPEVGVHLTESVRHFLLANRALIDWALERIERRRAGSSEPSAASPAPSPEGFEADLEA